MTDDGRTTIRVADRRSRKWWQEPRWLFAVAAIWLAAGFSLYAWSSYQSVDKIDKTAAVVAALERNQAGVDELVAFVHDLQAQQAGASNGTADVVKVIEQLLCSSTDVARQMACVRLDINPVEVP